MLHRAFLSLGRVDVYLGVQQPTHPLQSTVMDYAFKINALAGELERGVPPPPVYDDDGGLNVSGSGSDFDSDGGAPLAATTSA
jgi:hypothetical protein